MVWIIFRNLNINILYYFVLGFFFFFSLEKEVYFYKVNWRRKIEDIYKWIKMRVEFKYVNDNYFFCIYRRWKYRVYDYSWNLGWEILYNVILVVIFRLGIF